MTAIPLVKMFPGAVTRELLVSASPGWNAFNPSIAWSPHEGYKIIIRSSNYRLNDQGQYNVADPAGTIRTRNFIGTLDSRLDLVDLHLIKPPDWGPVLFPQVLGLEDARLYWQQGRWKVYGTLRQHRWDGLCQIGEATLDHDQLVDPHILENPAEGTPQKNWMKFGEESDFVYTCYPPQVWNEHGLKGPEDYSHWRVEALQFRGGSPVIGPEINETSGVSIIHEVDWTTGHRRYFHRLCLFDRGYLIGFTPPFFFQFSELLDDVPMIEYAAGMVSYGDNYVVSFGFQDSRAFLATIPKAQVISVMETAFA